MHEHIVKYTNKLLRDRTAESENIRFYVLDDRVITNRQDEWLPVFTGVFAGLDVTTLLFAKATLPFADLLVERAGRDADRLVPNDSETRVFLHDIPFIRESEWSGKPKTALTETIIRCLKERKAVIIQGLGVVASGGVTVEQAFIGFSSIFHTTFVKYLLDLLTEGFRLPRERNIVEAYKRSHPGPQDLRHLEFAPGPIEDRQTIMKEICRVGRYTVEKGYVDSFFGNISYFDGKTIFISQTTSSLDELEGFIDPVPLDGSSTAGLSASSELPAHRGIYVSSDYHAVLHGHPRFSVIMSMHCEEENCGIEDCNRFCNRDRSVCGVPIVAGETGAGGLAKSVPLALKNTGVCIVYGHGIFAAGKNGFRDAFMKMSEVEDRCREEYFRLLEERSKFRAQSSK
ncbi:MAG TPA: class II aldolase/adducin family protein [Nitrospirota bacterium]|nr:class II aldolase/adducin family protein [Nitrospirota bacterium]